MTRPILAEALRGRLVGAAAANVSAPIKAEPMDEVTLAREIARIMERRPAAAPRPPVMTTRCARWLGDEADRAAVEAYLASTQPTDGTPHDGAGPDVSELAVSVVAESVPANDGKRGYVTGTAAQWVRQARRDRWRTKLRDAAGLTLSLAISLILVVAVGLAIYS